MWCNKQNDDKADLEAAYTAWQIFITTFLKEKEHLKMLERLEELKGEVYDNTRALKNTFQ